jgi:hypothetical protein
MPAFALAYMEVAHWCVVFSFGVVVAWAARRAWLDGG